MACSMVNFTLPMCLQRTGINESLRAVSRPQTAGNICNREWVGITAIGRCLGEWPSSLSAKMATLFLPRSLHQNMHTGTWGKTECHGPQHAGPLNCDMQHVPPWRPHNILHHDTKCCSPRQPGTRDLCTPAVTCISSAASMCKNLRTESSGVLCLVEW